jgi:hypothetical protein
MMTKLSGTLDDALSVVSIVRRWTNPVNRAVSESPRPLIHPEGRMIVVFSPKSACTSVVAWFLHQLGEAGAARAYHASPHQYRINVYYKSKTYYRALNLDLRGFRVVRVVSDPIDRAASSFRYAQRSGLTDDALAELPGRPNAGVAGMSFREFLDLLERMDLTTCNEHFRIQRHPVEDQLPVTHLINVTTQDLFARLNEVERDLGLPLTDFDRMEWIKSLDERRGHFSSRIDTADAYEMRLTRSQARKGPWPSTSALLTPIARERLARLYAVDIAAYGEAPVREKPQEPSQPLDRRAQWLTRRRRARAERRSRRGGPAAVIRTNSGS